MSFLERGQKCSGWIDKIGKCDWSHACQNHDMLYITVSGRYRSKLSCDAELFKDVWKVCKPMAVIMWLGVTVFPISYYFWYKHKKDRNAMITIF